MTLFNVSEAISQRLHLKLAAEKGDSCCVVMEARRHEKYGSQDSRLLGGPGELFL